MFGRKKKQTESHFYGTLICTTEEEYKDLLRQKIALQLLTESMTERNGQYYIESWKVETIGQELATHFDPTWKEVMDKCEAIINDHGEIKLTSHAVVAWGETR